MFDKIKTALMSAKSFENFEFTMDGVDCFISRNTYPVSAFSMGCRGSSTTVYGYATGTQPEADEVAVHIYDCILRRPKWMVNSSQRV